VGKEGIKTDKNYMREILLLETRSKRVSWPKPGCQPKFLVVFLCSFARLIGFERTVL
jgi:hypothetical protein